MNNIQTNTAPTARHLRRSSSFASSFLLLAALAWLVAGCGRTTSGGGASTATPTAKATAIPTAKATATPRPTCASVFPGSSAIDLRAHGFLYPMAYPTGTVSSTISVTASGPGLFTVNQITICTPGTSANAVQSFYATHLPALEHGWMPSSLFPADGGLMTTCGASCFWNPKGGDIYYMVFDQFTDHGSGVVSYRGRWAVFVISTLPTCNTNFDAANPGAQRMVDFVGSGATAFPIPPLSSIAQDNASGGLRGYDICSAGTAASVKAFLDKEVPADGWTKVTTSNAHCTIASNCWTKGGQYWSWGDISDPTLWMISYRQ